MKNMVWMFVLALFLFACSTQSKNQEESTGEETMLVDEPQDLSEFEYVCEHCQLGSHEAGTCPCGMEYEKNPNFAGELHESHDHDGADLTSYEYICTHCQMGSHEAGKCACGMEYEKNPDFKSAS